MKKSQTAGARFAMVAIVTTLLLGTASAAHAQLMGTKASPLSLYSGTTVLARAAGNVDRSGVNFTTSNMAVKDMSANGNSVFLEVRTTGTYWYNDGTGLKTPTFDSSRWKSSKVSSGATWTNFTSVTKSITPAYNLFGAPGTIKSQVCEDRGVWTPDPCKWVTQTF